MDFGDILKEWETMRARGVRSRQEAGSAVPAKPRRKAMPERQDTPGGTEPSAGPEAAARDYQLRWLDSHAVEDKDRVYAERRQQLIHRHLSRREIDALPYDAILDLHGMTALMAESALEDFFMTAVAKDLRKVLLIHGKGIHSRNGPVLADIVRRWLERHPAAGRSGAADTQDGGSGATWVLLKKV